MVFAKSYAQLVALIKPQFEVGRAEVGKGGVVRDEKLHRRVCDEVREWLAGKNWNVAGITESPITGPKGNVEFLIAARLDNYSSSSTSDVAKGCHFPAHSLADRA